jgi:hypothetical protein
VNRQTGQWQAGTRPSGVVAPRQLSPTDTVSKRVLRCAWGLLGEVRWRDGVEHWAAARLPGSKNNASPEQPVTFSPCRLKSHGVIGLADAPHHACALRPAVD